VVVWIGVGASADPIRDIERTESVAESGARRQIGLRRADRRPRICRLHPHVRRFGSRCAIRALKLSECAPLSIGRERNRLSAIGGRAKADGGPNVSGTPSVCQLFRNRSSLTLGCRVCGCDDGEHVIANALRGPIPLAFAVFACLAVPARVFSHYTPNLDL